MEKIIHTILLINTLGGTMNKEIIIRTRNLCKTFYNGQIETPVIRNLDLSIYKNDFTAIMGASGSGKSTLLYLISGLDDSTGGSIGFDDLELGSLKPKHVANFRRDKIGFVFQTPNLLDNLTVFENIAVPGYSKKKSKKEVNNYAEEILVRLGIQEQRNKYPSQLSGGQQQRVAIGRSLINKPEVIFADEPTGALNASQSENVMKLLTELNNEGQTIVMVTHGLKAACSANRILFMNYGKIKGELSLDTFHIETIEEREEVIFEFLKTRGW